MNLQPKPQNGNQKIIKTLAKESGFGTWNVRAVLRPESIKEFIPHIQNRTAYMLWPYRIPDGKGRQ